MAFVFFVSLTFFFILLLALTFYFVLVMEGSLADLRLDDEDEREENEGWKVDQDVQEGETGLDLTLVGCFLTTKAVNYHSMKSTLENLWHSLAGVTIMDTREKRFTFRFYYEVDIDRVLNGALWTFNNHLLIFYKLRDEEDLLGVPLFHTAFWV